MAELLIKAVSASHPTKDHACYKQGDIVEVRDDGTEWGAKEVLPPQQGGKFVRVRIIGVTAEQVQNWSQNNWSMLLHNEELNEAGVMVRRRTVNIDVDLLPNPVKSQLNQTGYYENTWLNIRQYVRNKITNTTAEGSDL